VPNFHFFPADGTCAFIAQAPGVKAMPPGSTLANPPFFGTYFNVLYEQNAIIINIRDPRDDQSLRYGYAVSC